MGLCTACLTSSHPADGTPAGLAEVAGGLSAPSLLQVESRGSASTPSIPLPCSIKGNQGCHHIQSGPSSSRNSLKTFGLGAFYLFLFVLIPFNTLHSLSPNREWIPKQGDHPLAIPVRRWMRSAHSGTAELTFESFRHTCGKATSCPMIPGCLLPCKPGNLQCNITRISSKQIGRKIAKTSY